MRERSLALIPTEPAQADRAGEEVRSRVEAERLRIARELHDVVAYSFATINLQAGVAVHVAEERPEQVVEALHAIKEASGEAMRELRAILGMLRHAGDDEREGAAPGLGGLDALASTTTKAGVLTRVAVRGRPRPLSASVDQAAYRIVQEALANVLRHAGRASAAVTVGYEKQRLIVEIEDDGRGHAGGGPSDGSGHGIVGMRERALALGGALQAGAGPEGGFRVRASLPFSGQP